MCVTRVYGGVHSQPAEPQASGDWHQSSRGGTHDGGLSRMGQVLRCEEAGRLGSSSGSGGGGGGGSRSSHTLRRLEPADGQSALWSCSNSQKASAVVKILGLQGSMGLTYVRHLWLRVVKTGVKITGRLWRRSVARVYLRLRFVDIDIDIYMAIALPGHQNI